MKRKQAGRGGVADMGAARTGSNCVGVGCRVVCSAWRMWTCLCVRVYRKQSGCNGFGIVMSCEGGGAAAVKVGWV